MYLPQPFAVTDLQAIADLITRYNFAQMITSADGRMLASSLPVLLHHPDPDSDAYQDPTTWRLQGHLARPNPQVEVLLDLSQRDTSESPASDSEILVLFQGPHAYISPTAYPAGPAVPTWNYLQVQARGRVHLLNDEEAAAFLEQMVTLHEQDLAPSWSLEGQKERFLQMQRRGILTFELHLTDLQCKAKLNQNKSAAHLAGTLDWLKQQPGDEARETARWTERLCDL
ncbi:FMN-binding negative transcriptional regulator [Rhodovibrionaceae bacterium A322]